jgi:hypothetical protein
MNEDDQVAEQLGREIAGEAEANQVLTHPRYQQAMISYKAELFEAFISSKDTDADKRESIYRQSKCIRTVEANLAQLIKTGKLARKSLNLNGEEI